MPEPWFFSVEQHFGKDTTRMREWFYGPGNGAPDDKREIYIARYLRHYEEVEAYFRDRPNDYLRLGLAAGLGWRDLCGFLDLPEPDVPFPISNVAAAASGVVKKAARHRLLGSFFREMANGRRPNWT